MGNGARCGGSLLVLLCTSAWAFDADRCMEYAQAGYCTQRSTAKYMSRHCSSNCASATEDDASEGDEPNCLKWKEDGYCEHEEYKEYMHRSCANVCGVTEEGAEEKPNFEEGAAPQKPCTPTVYDAQLCAQTLTTQA